MDAPALATSPTRLARLPSRLLGQAALHAQRLVAEVLAAEGVRKHHFAVMVALDEGGPASQAALGRRLSIDRSDMAAVVMDLERDGLLSRERDERDRRRNVVRLTPAGRRLLRRLETCVAGAQETLLEPLSAAERADLERLLLRVVAHHDA